MKKLTGCIFFSFLFILAPWVWAQDTNSSLSDSGVLVSGSSDSNAAMVLTDQDNSNSSLNQDHQSSDSNSTDVSNISTDPIIIKATNAMMFQITANMKLTPEQIKTIEPIIMGYIVKVRDLQLSLQNGNIDGKAMYNQREELFKEEDRELNHILTSDQMNIWTNIQNQ